ncbi:TetR/AcrR family transcriptional regulator [Pelagibacterium lacus]|nr:TetR/AcrR family transcriptional regulator [Pelagibacterium lacus]
MSRGRARRFDLETALDRAEAVFRARGFAAAGISDLMAAMGIGAGSFYAAFDSKTALYEQVLARHARTRLAVAQAALAHPDAQRALDRLLEATADDLCRPGMAPGCLFVLSGAQRLDGPARCWHRYRAALAEAIAAACARLDRAGPRAAHILAILDAMSIAALVGSERAALMDAARAALDCHMAAASPGGTSLAA